MSKIREELFREIKQRIDIDEGKGHPADWTAKHILALFDRYEREQWSKAGEAPTGISREVLVHDDREARYQPSIELFWPGRSWNSHWRFRELPPGPVEDQPTKEDR